MIEKELKRYLLSFPEIKEMVGDHVYAGRVPRTAKPDHAVLIRRISNTRTYRLDGEEPVTQPVISFDLLSRHSSSEVILDRLFEYCRKALNEYAKAPGKMGSIWVTRIQIISETVEIPQPPIASGNSWKRQRSFDVEIMHEQEVEFV